MVWCRLISTRSFEVREDFGNRRALFWIELKQTRHEIGQGRRIEFRQRRKSGDDPQMPDNDQKNRNKNRLSKIMKDASNLRSKTRALLDQHHDQV